MKEAISQEMMTDSSHSCIPEEQAAREHEGSQATSGFKSAAMLGIALSVGASGVIVSQSEASAAISAPSTSAETLSTSPETAISADEIERADQNSEDQGAVAFHTVETGQSLWQIAQQHRVGLRELKEANSLPQETSIRVGQVLKVPVSDLASASTTEASSTTSSTLIAGIASERITEVVTEVAKDQFSAQLAEKPVAEVALNEAVEDEPSVSALALPESEASVSQISIEIADASQEIARVERAAAQASPTEGSALEPAPVVTALATPASFSHYQVRSGDTLSKIASSLGTTSEELMRANALANPNIILAGDTLRIPSSSLGYIPAQSMPDQSVPVASERPSAQIEPASRNQLAYLRDTAIREEDSALLAELRGAAPQEPASVGGETVTKADLLSSRSEDAEIDPYVANLLEEVREIRSRSVQVSEVEADVNEVALAEENRSESDSASLLARRNERQASSSISERISRAEQPSNEGIDSELLAAAPLSPDAYIPAQRPSAGQVVSPDMPVLPDAEEYLPEAPDYFDGYIWPARGTLTSEYGWRWGRMHRGVDVAGPVGTPIVAAGAGVVERAGWSSGGYGNIVEIRHPDGSMTRYAHNNSLNVSVGQSVRQGQQIAGMGSTGYSTGPHLHFEIHKSGSGAVNPMAYLPRR